MHINFQQADAHDDYEEHSQHEQISLPGHFIAEQHGSKIKHRPGHGLKHKHKHGRSIGGGFWVV